MKEVESKLPKGHKLKNERGGKGDHVFFDVVDANGNSIQTPVPVGGAKKGKNRFSSSLKATATNAGNFIKKVHQAIDDVQAEKDEAPTTAKRMSAAYQKHMDQLPAKEKYKKASSIIRKMSKKTFEEFVSEAYLTEIHKTREDAEAYYKENPPVGGDPYYIRNKGPKKGWQAIRKSSFKKQKERRNQRLKGMTYGEILSFVKRNLKPKPSEVAKAAQKIEREQKAAQTREAKKKTQETGTKHVVDHKQPQQDKRRPENRERFERVSPGDVSSNRQVKPEPENLAKGSKPPKKGEPGHGTTRSGAIKKVVDKAEEK